MPLGMAKDSMIKLSELVKEKEEDDSLSNLPTPHGVGEEIVTALPEDLKDENGGDGDDDDDGNGGVTGGKDLSSLAESALTVPEMDSQLGTSLSKTGGSYKSSERGESGLESSASSFDSDRPRGGDGGGGGGPSSAASIASNDTDSKMNGDRSKAGGAQQPAKEISYGQYSGFAMDYEDYQQYAGYGFVGKESLVPTYHSMRGIQKPNGGFWCCVFPWLADAKQMGDDDEDDDDLLGDYSEQPINENPNAPPARSSSRDDDEVSTGSDMFGERLSEKERQAVLARLGLAQPDVPNLGGDKKDATDATNNYKTGEEAGPSKKGLLKDIIPSDARGGGAQKRPRSILKRSSAIVMSDKMTGSNANDESSVNTSSKSEAPRRRSLFPVYDSKRVARKDLNVSFSPMARVISVKSHKDMSDAEKGDIWWLKSDYEAFRKTGRMITKAMLEGGSEIWLASNRSWHMPNQNRATTLKNAYNLSQQQQQYVRRNNLSKDQVQEYERMRDKWWHKFGHSRRGLEHIASIDEGRQRQSNVRTAIRAVLDEQRRQKVFRREDAEKLRMVSIQHTSWARDLAAAAGASDQDAVKEGFNDESRKSREFYLIKFARSNTPSGQSQRANVPAFMKPMLHVPVTATHRLDANTASQIRYRQTKKKKTLTSASSTASASSDTKSDLAKSDDPSDESCEPIRTEDRPKMASEDSMAKRAAGFASGEEVANMSAVLSGMGPVPKSPVSAVGGP